jgi:hypothetical protein
MKIWEPKPPGTLWATTGLLRDSFTFTFTIWGWVVNATHRPPLPPAKTRYPLYRRLGRPQEWSGRVGKISPPPGFDPRTIQPVASRYTDCAIPADCTYHTLFIFSTHVTLSSSALHIHVFLYKKKLTPCSSVGSYVGKFRRNVCVLLQSRN